MASGTGRLDRQSMTRRAHVRKNSRQYRRGYKVLPHNVWGDDAKPPRGGGTSGQTATGCTAGKPGSFTPAGCTVPGTLAELRGLGALGQTAAWTTGQYVFLNPSGSAYWDGTTWQLGVKP